MLLLYSGECYQRTKSVLHSALPSDDLIGRISESKVISDFLTDHISKMVPGSMYVSGAPGTGKTAVLMKAIEKLQVCTVCDIVHTSLLLQMFFKKLFLYGFFVRLIN